MRISERRLGVMLRRCGRHPIVIGSLVLLAALACNDVFGPVDVASVSLHPAADTLGLGETVRLIAVLTRPSGDTLSGLRPRWATSDTLVVQVDSSGSLLAEGIGTATVTATIGTASAAAAITVADSAPTISSINPPSGTGSTVLTIRGTKFRAGAIVLLDTLVADSITLVSDSVVTAAVPSADTEAGTTHAVFVRNTDGTRAEAAMSFTVIAPVLQYVNGTAKASAEPASAIVIEGRAFGDRRGAGQVLFSDGAGGTIPAVIAGPAAWTDSVIAATVPAGAATGPVIVQTASGTSVADTLTIGSGATFDPSAVSWTATTSLPVGLSGHAAAVGFVGTSNVVYVAGGEDSTNVPRTDVIFAAVQSDGALGTWTTTTALPTPTAFATAVVGTPYNSRLNARAGTLYVLGGIPAANGAPKATVFQGALDSNGQVLSWSGRGLPVPLHSLSAAIVEGDLYIAGGSTDGDVPVATVYRARIDSLGGLGPWQEELPLPSARSYAGFGAVGGYLYSFGGDGAAVVPNDASTSGGTKLDQIAYARIDLVTGQLASPGWVINASPLDRAVSKHSATLFGGAALISGGLYSGAATGAAEESYALVNGDGSVGSFAVVGGSQTIASAGGGNLFNQASVAYVDAAGVAHVIVLGGDDVNNPGKKHVEVWRY